MNYLNLGLGIIIGMCIKDPKFRKNLVNESNKILKDIDNILLKKNINNNDNNRENDKENEKFQNKGDKESINE